MFSCHVMWNSCLGMLLRGGGMGCNGRGIERAFMGNKAIDGGGEWVLIAMGCNTGGRVYNGIYGKLGFWRG